MKCEICNIDLTGTQKRFCSIKCKNKYHQSYDKQKKRSLERKLKLISLFNSKCSSCGYNRNLAALAFHHIDDKDFKLDARSLSNRKWSLVLEEVKKCTLLCHNCHMELHYPHFNLAVIAP